MALREAMNILAKPLLYPIPLIGNRGITFLPEGNSILIENKQGSRRDFIRAVRDYTEDTSQALFSHLGLTGIECKLILHHARDNYGKLSINGMYYGKEHPQFPKTIGMIIYSSGNLAETVDLETKIKQKASHEAAHAARDELYGQNHSLGDVLVNEGLAIEFSRQFSGKLEIVGDTPSLSDEEVSNLELRALQDRFSEDSNVIRSWFHHMAMYGSGIPLQAGYDIGYRIVTKYLQAHPYEPIEDLIKLPTTTFFD